MPELLCFYAKQKMRTCSLEIRTITRNLSRVSDIQSTESTSVSHRRKKCIRFRALWGDMSDDRICEWTIPLRKLPILTIKHMSLGLGLIQGLIDHICTAARASATASQWHMSITLAHLFSKPRGEIIQSFTDNITAVWKMQSCVHAYILSFSHICYVAYPI